MQKGAWRGGGGERDWGSMGGGGAIRWHICHFVYTFIVVEITLKRATVGQAESTFNLSVS